ncbi:MULTISPECIES: hypothetical protein [unclassified Bradyrhizobium]|uniref:hypothetical protein n=1 Tax=unclassified Bradyrhizobium TaxID=2631580 RepID=UPI001178A574|nr:hypothetical protein [Bradyrhizobium sp. Y36]GMO12010.1 hypothetical protein TM233_06520 [Bradyrhizobium sp. TM233]GMP08846.1 hypothetical protein TM239_53110 [Bradyrhizobium sp. TM239]
MKSLAISVLALTAIFTVSASAKDALQATRDCMVAHGAVRNPDGSVRLNIPRKEALAVRDKCRKQSGYKGTD